jgi:hypothetical protein
MIQLFGSSFFAITRMQVITPSSSRAPPMFVQLGTVKGAALLLYTKIRARNRVVRDIEQVLVVGAPVAQWTNNSSPSFRNEAIRV